MKASGEDKEIIESLVTSYIKKPSCIILLTIACESTLLPYRLPLSRSYPLQIADWENQRGFDLAQKYDPDGKRTIGKSSRRHTDVVQMI